MVNFIEYPANKLSLLRRKLVVGVGINDSGYKINYVLDGKRVTCPYYTVWHGMLSRCHSESQQKIHPTYKGCTVVNEWFLFSNFKSWMQTHNWQGKALDKDIVTPGNRVYSPLTCVFVAQEVNNLLGNSRAKRGKFPQGVSYFKRTGRFVAHCCVDGIKKHLGFFSTPGKAAATYNTAKSQEIRRVAALETDVRIRDGLLKHAELRYAS